MKISVAMLAIGLLLSGAAGSEGASAQEESQQQMMQQRMMEEGAELMSERTALLEQLEQSGQRLTELLATVRSTEGDPRTDAMAELLGALVAEHQALIEAAVQLQPRMMQHMLAHMGMGMEAMSMCPMMQSMGATATPDAAPVEEGNHEEHH